MSDSRVHEAEARRCLLHAIQQLDAETTDHPDQTRARHGRAIAWIVMALLPLAKTDGAPETVLEMLRDVKP